MTCLVPDCSRPVDTRGLCRPHYVRWHRGTDVPYQPLPPASNERYIPPWHDTWVERAKCLTADPEIFFPEKGQSTEPAKAICNGDDGLPPCPAKEECLDYALKHRQWFGVWGGMSEPQRRRLSRRRGAA